MLLMGFSLMDLFVNAMAHIKFSSKITTASGMKASYHKRTAQMVQNSFSQTNSKDEIRYVDNFHYPMHLVL
jgi:hypothetical protein